MHKMLHSYRDSPILKVTFIKSCPMCILCQQLSLGTVLSRSSAKMFDATDVTIDTTAKAKAIARRVRYLGQRSVQLHLRAICQRHPAGRTHANDPV